MGLARPSLLPRPQLDLDARLERSTLTRWPDLVRRG